jgi:predicted dehydrogenase
MKNYRAAVIGCSRMGGFIDNEVVGARKHVPPYSHGAGFFACTRTDLVACADPRTDVMEKFGERYNIPKERQYTDYREMIAAENLDIVSVATQPEPRAEIVIVIYAAEHGIKAIYAEKALSASLPEAQAMVDALTRNNVFINMGTNRRWSVYYDKMKEIIDSGDLGALKSLIIYLNGTLFNTGSHTLDLLCRLNSDQPIEWVQAFLTNADGMIDGDTLSEDPQGEGIFQFANGVRAYALFTARGLEVEAICEKGTVTALNDGIQLSVRKRIPIDDAGHLSLEQVELLEIEPQSSTLGLIEDLVHALDTGEPTRGGPEVCYTNMELIFAFIESHRQGGARVHLPIQSNLRLQRSTAPKTPKFSV